METTRYCQISKDFADQRSLHHPLKGVVLRSKNLTHKKAAKTYIINEIQLSVLYCQTVRYVTTMSYPHTIKYEYLKTNERATKGNKSRDSSPESPHAGRQISLSPPRRDRDMSPRPSSTAASHSLALNGHPKQQHPSTTGRRVSFMYGASVDVDSAHPKAVTTSHFTPRDTSGNNRPDDSAARKARKKSPPKWARGKKEWNPEKLMDFWSQANNPKR